MRKHGKLILMITAITISMLVVISMSSIPRKVIVVGDSYGFLAPWECERIACPGAQVQEIIYRLQQEPVDVLVTDVIVLAGIASLAQEVPQEQIYAELDVLNDVVRDKFPRAQVYSVPLYAMVEQANSNPFQLTPDDIWHISVVGYEILRKHFFRNIHLRPRTTPLAELYRRVQAPPIINN